jgi:hypothetical protein
MLVHIRSALDVRECGQRQQKSLLDTIFMQSANVAVTSTLTLQFGAEFAGPLSWAPSPSWEADYSKISQSFDNRSNGDPHLPHILRHAIYPPKFRSPHSPDSFHDSSGYFIIVHSSKVPCQSQPYCRYRSWLFLIPQTFFPALNNKFYVRLFFQKHKL